MRRRGANVAPMSFSSRHSPMQLKVSAAPRPPDLVLVLDGVLSAGDAVAAQVELLNLAATCTGKLVLDCTRLTYVASVGLRALLALHRNVKGRCEGVWLAGVTDPVKHIFEVSGLLPHFQLTASVEQALTPRTD